MATFQHFSEHSVDIFVQFSFHNFVASAFQWRMHSYRFALAWSRRLVGFIDVSYYYRLPYTLSRQVQPCHRSQQTPTHGLSNFRAAFCL